MRVVSNRAGALVLLAALSMPASTSLLAQDQAPEAPKAELTVYGTAAPNLAGLPAGPEIKGVITARTGDKIKVTSPDGTVTIIGLAPSTKIKASGGFLGGGAKLTPDALLNGLPVTVKTVKADDGLYASQVSFKNGDYKTALMIRNGTAQQFDEQSAATEALRGRMGDIDQYNIKGTTNVYFDTGSTVLSGQAKEELCAAASQAEGLNNAFILVVGYTDSVGSEDYNQVLSEKRAGRVINYLQQVCRWKPFRMLTPTGMAESDPLADNTTAEGRAQNRRVSVNILVSKALDGM
ncbi:MAG: OmpA family protein [Novosphingobium sp.]|uniref:OmpA family protein n=1 Tax=Novosphingobium sp. TaxID=1874826 RepID=UPI0032BD65C9